MKDCIPEYQSNRRATKSNKASCAPELRSRFELPATAVATRLHAKVERYFAGGGTGGATARAELFESTQNGPYGGVVLRLTLEDGGEGCSEPFGLNIAGGVELHFRGDDEAEVFCLALAEAISSRKARRRSDHDVRVWRVEAEVPDHRMACFSAVDGWYSEPKHS